MINWKELKDFANSLNEEQLQEQVVLWQESEAISEISTQILTEDHYIGEDEEGCYPLSEATEPEEELTLVYKKGCPLLVEEI